MRSVGVVAYSPAMLLERHPSGFTLTLPVEPRGQGRARYSAQGGTVRAYTPAATRAAHDQIRHLWALAGRPEAPGAALFGLRLYATFKRPASHLTKSGLSAAGKRSRTPRPDVDNIAKLVLDALQGHAFQNDALCSHLYCSKRWGEDNGLVVTIEW